MPVPQEITDLVSQSGNNFHAKVARWMQGDDWHVAVSPYYMDQTQSKAREIDLVAEKAWPVTNFGGQECGSVVVRLFIECKFIPAYSVFWFTPKDMRAAKNLVCRSGGFEMNNVYTDKHHYLAESPRVAKLFSTPVGRNLDNDPYYRALNQVLNGMVSMRGGPVATPLQRKSSGPFVLLEFPVIVCSSFEKLYSVDFYADTAPERIRENFQFEIQYAYLDKGATQRDEHLLLDFVEFDQLQAFIAAIDADAKTAVFFTTPS